MEKILISKKKYESMKEEIKTLKNTKLYRKILLTNKELKSKTFTRKDLGF